MNKKFLNSMLFLLCSVAWSPLIFASEETPVNDQVEASDKNIVEFDDDFADFFAVDDSVPRTIERQEKEKMSWFKIYAIWLGIKCAIALEAGYKWVRDFCVYCGSFIGSQKNE